MIPPENVVSHKSSQGFTKIPTVCTVEEEVHSKVGVEEHIRPENDSVE